MRRLLVIGLCLATPAAAEEWHALDGPGIAAALAARVLRYKDGTTQNFFADGRTLFETASGDGESWGRWQVRADQYCSVWPPSDSWACYAVAAEARGHDLRFIAASGSVTTGRYQDLD